MAGKDEEKKNAVRRISEAFGKLLRGRSAKSPARTAHAASQQAGDGAIRGEEAQAANSPLPIHWDVAARRAKQTIEASLFLGDSEQSGWIAIEHLAAAAHVSVDQVESILTALRTSYLANGCPYTLSVQQGRARMELREEFHRLRESVLGQKRQLGLSRAAIEVLALAAYRQGLTLAEIDKVRGRSSLSVVNQLVRRGMLAVERPADDGPPKYAPTRGFLAAFGLSKLSDLPQTQDIDRI